MPDLATTRDLPDDARRADDARRRRPALRRRPGTHPRHHEDLVIAAVTQHAESVLRLARRVSLCDDDAQDAYQRALEILLRNVGRLEPDTIGAWLRTVAKHEAMAIRAQRQRVVGTEEPDLDRLEASRLPSPEDRAVSYDRVTRSAEALRALKPDEARALWLRSQGYSYAEIARMSDWSATKTNRLLTEGRRRFLDRYATIEAGETCAGWLPALSAIADGEAGPGDRLAVARHLRACAGCRATLRSLRDSGSALRAVLPAGLVVTSATPASGRTGLGGLADSLLAGLHDRASLTLAKAQVAADALSAGKAAAVAASAVALAGGGAVAVSTTPAPQHRTLPEPVAAATPAPTGKQADPAAVVTAPAVVRAAPGSAAAAQPTGGASVRRPRRAGEEFGAGAAAPARLRSRAAGAVATPEFDPVAPAVAAAGPVTAPARSTTSAPPSAGAEFTP